METESSHGQSRYRIEIASYEPSWVTEFDMLREKLAAALGTTAVRVDHIGSTSISGLAGKPILDVQISVKDLRGFQAYGPQLQQLGFRYREHNPEKTKRYFREASGDARTHIHVRQAGSWHEQWALLFRDYMRSHPAEYPAYEALKRSLAQRFPNDMETYTNEKSGHFWEVIRRADQWAKDTGWFA